MHKQDKIQWIINQHVNTNHMYDIYLPYEFHLRMVNENFRKFYPTIEGWTPEFILSVELGGWGHDLMEDTRTSYNDIRNMLGVDAAEIIRAVTNYSRGRNRDERMPDFVYNDIRNTPGAIFVKLCDRIANVQYGKMMGSSMFKKYKQENEHFLEKLGLFGLNQDMTTYHHMVKELNTILND